MVSKQFYLPESGKSENLLLCRRKYQLQYSGADRCIHYNIYAELSGGHVNLLLKESLAISDAQISKAGQIVGIEFYVNAFEMERSLWVL